MLIINNIRLNNVYLSNCSKKLCNIIQSKLDAIGVSYSVQLSNEAIIFSEVEVRKYFVSNKDNHIPINETDKRYKKEKPYLITNKLTESQYLSTERIVLTTLLNMGILCDIKLKDDFLVKDLVVTGSFPKPKTYPIGV